MGYSENLLPAALARAGADVHLITSDLQPPFDNYKEVYEPFIGPRQQPAGEKPLDGFVVRRLAHGRERPGVYLRGLYALLRRLKPDVVQCFTVPSWCTFQSAAYRLPLGYKLFLEEHVHRSVFEPPRGIKARIRAEQLRLAGRLVSLASVRCYAIAPDVAELVAEEYGYSASKTTVCPLGVETELFRPARDETESRARHTLRDRLGFAPDDIVCVYSGRFSADKNPQCLARAIDRLQRRGTRVRGLFIGSGPTQSVAAIDDCAGCVIHPFVPWRDLPPFYRAADIAVWPQQESTSQLDAVACGLPIIVSNQVTARERYEGHGLTYEEGNDTDLARRIELLVDPDRRRTLGAAGVQNMQDQFSWNRIARQRLADYGAALGFH
jgi:glycosyltransferase involved in cell wall biosynthesis